MGEAQHSGNFDVLPPAADVVIVGGGIVGVSTAYFLAKKGLSVVLCEKGGLGEEQSSRNWGWVRKMGRDVREIPLMIRAMEIWKDLNAICGTETGFRVRGITYFFDKEGDAARYDPWMKAVAPYDLDTRLIGQAEIDRIAPGATHKWAGALHTPSDGFAEPHLATRAIAAAARAAGAHIVEACAVRGVETSAGTISHAVTERGTVRCNAVVLAGGSWSTFFARNMGVRLPQMKILSQVARTRPLTGGPIGCGSGPGFGFRQRLDGGYNFSMRALNPVDITPDGFRYFKDYIPALKHEWRGMLFRVGEASVRETLTAAHWKLDQRTVFEKVRILRPKASDKVLNRALANIRRIFPHLGEIQVAERMAAWIDTSPDAIPVISGVDSQPGFYIATGFSGHGFGLGPAAGELMAQIVAGETPMVDITPFRHSRFIDGSPIEHWPVAF
ncbi:NAD(P)/FAD-dependent oxidoreductase [Ruixingdingia sedimenti]|uniref:FAD-binding oxidoreductase n=1 Tax=Ruixingdingia sedimenti TaxID=3073604 RepID=A0ABU1F6S3_9RHOB|nr:FAD-binding oxidoreductase [Xinfangfangia sp. LG-4]MDR5652575.1 FAD-binding oxidoreductase [Xinfangfangia sp. LG-4]